MDDYTFYPGGRELVMLAICEHEKRRADPGWREPINAKSSCYAYPDDPLVALRDAAGPIAVYRITSRARRPFSGAEHVIDGGIEDLQVPGADPVVTLAREYRQRVGEYLAVDEERGPSRLQRAANKISAAEERLLATSATSIRGVIEKLLILHDVALDATHVDDAGNVGALWGLLQDLQILAWRYESPARADLAA